MGDMYDFLVSDVDYVINRESTKGWGMYAGVKNKYVMVINLKGKCEYETNGQTIKLLPGDVCIFPPNNVRSSKTDEISPWHFISVSFTLKYLDGSDCYMGDLLPMVTRNVHRQVIDNFKKISDVWNNKPTAYKTICRTVVQDILCQIIQINEAVIHNPNHYAKIEIVKKYISDNYTKAISVDELAALVGLSQSHFRKIFREIVGMSATQYAIYLRINKAKDLLLSGSANVSEAAFQSGFKDVFYFSSLFKKITGENPSKYLR